MRCDDCRDCPGACGCSARTLGPEPWVVPFVPAGEAGWKESSRLFCPALLKPMTSSVWSDGTNVYAMVSGIGERGPTPAADEDAGVLGEPETPASERTRVLRNDGSGWKVLADLPGGSNAAQLTGIPPSSPVVYGLNAERDGARACVLGVISGGRVRCESGVTQVSSVQALADGRAYALADKTVLLDYDGRGWQQELDPLPRPAMALWAGAEAMVAVGEQGTILHRRGSEAWELETLPSNDALWTVWARGEDDVYAGTADGELLHFDGVATRPIARLGGVTCEGGNRAILGIVGVGEHVWFYGERQLSRWDGTKVEMFGNWTCLSGAGDSITAVWANTEDDVFISVMGPPESSQCGHVFVVHYDGAAFHRF